MKKNVSSFLLMVLILNMVGIFATILPVTTVVAAPVNQPLLTENFDTYADSTAMTNAGYTVGSTGTLALPTSPTVGQGNILQLKNGMTAAKTFAPVSVKDYTGAINPGKNAKLKISFDLYMSGGTGATKTYISFEQSQKMVSGGVTFTPTAVSVGRKAGRSNYEYSNSIDSSLTSYVLGANARLVNIKAEIKITDSDGNFYSTGPKVTMWYDNNVILGCLGMIKGETQYVDKFSLSSGTSTTSELDNLSISLETDDTYVPTPRTITNIIDGGSGTLNSTTTNSSVTVNDNDSKTITLKAGTGMQIDYFKVNDQIVTLSKNNLSGYSYYTIPYITADTTVNVRFKPLTYDITVTIDDTQGAVINTATGLAVKNGQAVTVDYGTSADFKVISYGGKVISSVVYAGGAAAGGGQFSYSFNTGSVTAANTLVVTFVDYAPANPEVNTYNQVFTGVESEAPYAVSYGTVQGTDYASFGIIIWSTGETNLTIDQIAPGDLGNGKYILSAAKGLNPAGLNLNTKQFGVGIKSLPTGNYQMRTYVAYGTGQYSYGDVATFSIS